MDSEMEERKLPSIRRPQLLFIYRKSGVDNPATFGQIVCSVRRLPIRFTVGTGGTIRNRYNQLRAQSGMRSLTALHFHRESRGENVCVLSKMIVRVGVFVEILE